MKRQGGLIAVLAAAGLLLAAGNSSAQTGSSGNWLHFGYDGGYGGYAEAETILNVGNVPRLKQKWGIGCDDGKASVISRAPALYDGKLYSTGAGTNLSAYDAKSGKLLWSFGPMAVAWAPQPVVSPDGKVLFSGGQNEIYDLYAVDAASGQQVWQSPVQFGLGYNDTNLVTVDAATNRVYVVEQKSSNDRKLYSLDLQTGSVVWYLSEAKDGFMIDGRYVLVKDGDVFALGVFQLPESQLSEVDFMARIDPATIQVKVRYDRPVDGNHDIRHYAICGDTLVVNYDLESVPEKVVAAYQLDAPEPIWVQTVSTLTGDFACNPETGWLLVPTDPTLYALDLHTGEPVWSYTGFAPIHTPSIANGVVYFLSDTNMYAIDSTTGQELFSFRLGAVSYENTQVAISNGMVYFSGNGGTCDLYALGLPWRHWWHRSGWQWWN